MQTSRRLIISIAALGCVSLSLYFYPNQKPKTEHIHYHAGFKVYIANQLQDYSGYQYMNYTPCSVHDEKKSAAEEQIEKAHLHENVGDVVHVHRDGSVWGDLFTNLKVNLPKDKVIAGFIDGKEVDEIMKMPIDSYTTAIILVGENDASRGAEIVPRNHIEEVEKQSELCGS